MPTPRNLRAVKSGLYSEIIASDPGGGTPFVASRNLGGVALRAQLNRVVGDLTRYTEASIKLATLESLELLTLTTPVDTGWASASWFPGYGGRTDNGGYLVDPGDEESETVSSFDDFSHGDDDAAAFLREFDPEYEDKGGASGEILSIENEFKLQERRAEQESAISSFASKRIFINQYVALSPEITNHVPYIVELNEGKSEQTPRGFVQRALTAGLSKLELRANAIAFGGRIPRFIV